MHCVNFDKFRDTTSKVIKRENLAKAKNDARMYA